MSVSGGYDGRRGQAEADTEALLSAPLGQSSAKPASWWAGSAVEVALLDRHGVIEAVNDAWRDFCLANGGDISRAGVGISYLAMCDLGDDPGCRSIRTSLCSALRGDLPAPVTVTIPCDGPDHAAFFDVLISSRYDEDGVVVGASICLSQTTKSGEVGGAGQVLAAPDPTPGSGAAEVDDGAVAERDRMASVLNDQVISRVSLLGLGLQGLLTTSLSAQDRQRVASYVAATDEVIDQIRAAVFGSPSSECERVTVLSDRGVGGGPSGENLKLRVLECVDSVCRDARPRTEVSFNGDFDDTLDDDVVERVSRVIRTCLEDVVQGAHAHLITVTVSRGPQIIAVDLGHDGEDIGHAVWARSEAWLGIQAHDGQGGLALMTATDGTALLHWTTRVTPARTRS